MQGKKLGRPKATLPFDRLTAVANLTLDDASRALGVSRSTLKRWRRAHKSISPAA
jgi:hypothetical protein